MLLETREPPHDANVLEARLLSDLSQQAVLEALIGIQAAGRDLSAYVRVLRIFEDEQLCAPVACAGEVGDDSAAFHSTSSSAWGISPRAPRMRT
jgi:hypothetical protein